MLIFLFRIYPPYLVLILFCFLFLVEFSVGPWGQHPAQWARTRQSSDLRPKIIIRHRNERHQMFQHRPQNDLVI